MPDLLLELFSEEIPARMQARAAEDLQKLVTGRLVDAGLTYEGARAFATPRRLALWVQGLPVRQADLREQKRGPRVGAPEAAIQGFLRSAGLASIGEARVEKDAKKGEFYVAVVERPGRSTLDVIAAVLPEVVRGFPWPKSMRWADGELAWVRPLHAIVATFGPETEEPEVVPFSIDGIAADDKTYGHRFMAPDPIRVRRLDDYVAKLRAAKVIVDAQRRADEIRAEAQNLAFAQGLALVEDDALLAEVAGLVEWPVVLMGSFDASFLAMPPEVIRTTIRNNQKCFVLQQPGGGLAARFVLVANIEAVDGGTAIVAGNERVIRARLSDAKFFYEQDLKVPLEARLEKLKEIVFHEKLGTQWERVERIERLARTLAPSVGADPDMAARAARLAKADLVTEMVGEFPELQGLMGRYYALAQGEDEAVARAIEEHYKPLGPADRVPTDPVSVAVAVADKIDALVGFWAIEEKPTGSKDPYALRRAALGVIRLVLNNELRVPLSALLSRHHPLLYQRESLAFRLLTRDIDGHFVYPSFWNDVPWPYITDEGEEIWPVSDFVFGDDEDIFVHHKSILPSEADNYLFLQTLIHEGKTVIDRVSEIEAEGFTIRCRSEVSGNLVAFFADRLKVQLREQGARHDLVDAVFALGGQDDLLLIVRRVEALAKFLDTDDGKNLLAGTKRAANIIRIEEKKDACQYTGPPDPALYAQDEERALAAAIGKARHQAEGAVAREDFEAAMRAMATLRPFVDAFFEKVTVNAPDPVLRENRLKLLNQIRDATRAVADFSRIES